MKIQYTNVLPPHIFRCSDNKYYLVPGWKELPEGTTIEDINWTNPYTSKNTILGTVTGSSGDTYTITELSNGKITCSCPGNTYKGKCKHTLPYINNTKITRQ